MATDIVIPDVGESVTSGVVASWLVAEGEYVNRDDTVLELETDKITMEVPAPAAGVLLSHAAAEGDEVEVGSVVGQIDESAEKPASGGGGAAAGSQAEAEADAGSGGTDRGSSAATATAERPGQGAAERRGAAADAHDTASRDNGAHASAPAEPSDRPPSDGNGAALATPLARKIAGENNVDLATVRGTGAGGRIREQDVLAAVQARGVETHAAPARPDAAPRSGGAPGPAGPGRTTRVEKMSPMRQRIASRLVEAQHTAAMLTTFNEVDMTAVMELRSRHKEDFSEAHGTSLGFMSFFVKACCGALDAFPAVNSSIVEAEGGAPALEYRDYADVAIAVSSPKGLVVPVLRNAESMSFAEIERRIKDFGARAKDGKLALEEMQGGTFTITNGGIFGSLMSTPILNPPQSAILGMHAIKKRAVEHPEGSGQVAIRPMMYLALSYDHRVVDGAGAVRFLVHIKRALEDPARLMLEL